MTKKKKFVPKSSLNKKEIHSRPSKSKSLIENDLTEPFSITEKSNKQLLSSLPNNNLNMLVQNSQNQEPNEIVDENVSAIVNQMLETDHLSEKSQLSIPSTFTVEKEIKQLHNCIEACFQQLQTITQMLSASDIEKIRLHSNTKDNPSYFVIKNELPLKKQNKEFQNYNFDNQFTGLSTEKLSQATKVENQELVNHLHQSNLQIVELNSKIVKYENLIAMLEKDQSYAAQKISELTHSELMLQQSLQERFDELAILTNLIVENEKTYQTKLVELRKNQPLVLSTINQSLTHRLKNKLITLKKHKSKAQQFARNVAIIRESELFDDEWYLQQYPQASSHKYGAAGHYLEYGVELKTNPSPFFDGNWYLQTYLDVSDSGMNPLFHYIKFGSEENRITKVL